MFGRPSRSGRAVRAAAQAPSVRQDSGAIAAVLGACFVLYPSSRVLTLVLVFAVKTAAWVLMGL